jgi:hypothetical protein
MCKAGWGIEPRGALDLHGLSSAARPGRRSLGVAGMSALVAASDRRLPNQCVQDHDDDGYEHATTDPDQGSKEQSCQTSSRTPLRISALSTENRSRSRACGDRQVKLRQSLGYKHVADPRARWQLSGPCGVTAVTDQACRAY